jgi:hypothetical protein
VKNKLEFRLVPVSGTLKDQLAKVAAQVEACRTSGEVHVAAN